MCFCSRVKRGTLKIIGASLLNEMSMNFRYIMYRTFTQVEDYITDVEELVADKYTTCKLTCLHMFFTQLRNIVARNLVLTLLQTLTMLCLPME